MLRLLQPAPAPQCPGSGLSEALVAARLLCLKAILLAVEVVRPGTDTESSSPFWA